MKHNHDKRSTCYRPLPRDLVKKTSPRHWQKIIKNLKFVFLMLASAFYESNLQ